MIKQKQFKVAEADDGIRLDRWFHRHYPNLPTAQVQKACRKGLIRVDGSKCESNLRIATGQDILVKFLDLEAAKARPERSLNPEIIAETQAMLLQKNRDYLLINKPAGLAVQGGSKLTDHLDARMSALQYDAKESPRLVHRLDRETSGVMLLARSAKAAADYAKLFQEKQVQKTYLAIICGVPHPRSGEIESRVEKMGRYEKMHLAEGDDGKKAITYYRMLDYLHQQLALVELEPITGRTHQLRVHMQGLGCPILGDYKYGADKSMIEGIIVQNFMYLHAYRLHIPSKNIDIKAPLPPHFKDAMRQLGLSL